MRFLPILVLCVSFFGVPAMAQDDLDFHGYDCTVDCSGHTAGYEWAEEKGITDPDDCGGNSNSFTEGCRAWAEEQDGTSGSDDFEHQDNQDDPSFDPEM